MGFLQRFLSRLSTPAQPGTTWPSSEHPEATDAIAFAFNQLGPDDQRWVSIFANGSGKPDLQIAPDRINLLLSEIDLESQLRRDQQSSLAMRVRRVDTGLYEMDGASSRQVAELAIAALTAKLGAKPTTLTCQIES